MRRCAISLLLIVLVLPYLRAPLCEAGSHEHEGHDPMAGMRALVEAPPEGADPVADCHSLMGCAGVPQASLPVAAAGFRSPGSNSDTAPTAASSQLRSRASPDTPPPKAA